jgi:Holliday junction resolvasome RuvABC DNA-binding subunit
MGAARAAEALVFSVSRVANAIENEDIEFLKKMKGIGDRMARTIVAELKGKVAEWALLRDEGYVAPPTEQEDLRGEVVEILIKLGYKRGEAIAKVEVALTRCPEVRDTQELIREVFKGERKRDLGRKE